MKIYEIIYIVNASQRYLAMVLAENTRQIPELLASCYGSSTISFGVINVQETHARIILTPTPIEEDVYNQLKEHAL